MIGKYFYILLMGFMMVALTSCMEKEGPAEEMGEKIDEQVEEIEEEME